ncbi:MAG: response regulator transcription factor [Candidatus Obscuribacterales bacterium]|nr:response regulator transcription factor [Candidatus Obscuribacterales bacterium]
MEKNNREDKKVRLLLVEDHEIMRFGLKKSLEQVPNFQIVAEAGTGPMAIEKALSLRPSVVLMDIGLPELDGIEATKQIKEAQPGIRVLMLTSFDKPEKIFASLAAGADGYCVKSIATEDLVSVIEKVVQGCAYLDPVIAGYVVKVYDIANDLDEEDDEMISSRLEIIDESELLQESSANLSKRELEVLKLLVSGHKDEAIATSLGIAPSTVRSHVRKILAKLAVNDRTQAALKATRGGIY